MEDLQPSTSKAHKDDQSEEDNEEAQGYETDSSSGDSDTTEKCPICLLKFGTSEIGRPGSCEHSFCLPCIEEWSKVVRTCPIDRKEFSQINVYGNLEDNNLLRTVGVGKQISLNDYAAASEEQFTSCEVCGSVEREDVMLLCDGCDKGFHMDCLDPPMEFVPIENWYCQECESNESSEDEEETDEEEINDLQEEIESEIGSLPATRLRNRPAPQIVRTLQSERIRNAILARRSLRGLSEQASTSSAITQPKAKRKSPTKKRKSYRRKRSTVVEYEIREGGGKFPIKTTKRRVTRRRRKKKRKPKKRVAMTRKSATSDARSFCANQNVFELQHARHQAGVSNFNIFEPTNMLDYVPDDEENVENEPYLTSHVVEAGSGDGVLSLHGSINTLNPLRRKALIKKRVIDNFTTTSSSCDLIDSILNERNFFEKPSNRINYSEGVKVTKASDGNSSSGSSNVPRDVNESNNNRNESGNNQPREVQHASNSLSQSSGRNEDEQNLVTERLTSQEKSPQKKKKPVFDMFDEKTPERDESEPSQREECPNFSIYNMGDSDEHENVQTNQVQSESFDDLVQMSDEEREQQVSTEIVTEEAEPVVVFKSQPASPDLENEGEERSYTPPLMKIDTQKEDSKSASKKESHKKSKKDKKRQELERYNVRDRIRDKSPTKSRDRYGRNRTRTRSRSRSNRRRSRSRERKHRHRSRSDSRRRDSSDERRRRNKRKKSHRKSRSYSRSLSPHRRRNYRDERSPKRHRKRDRTPSPSEKSKKKKYRAKSKEKSSGGLTKEIYTSGQNIMVSVNFNDKRPSRSTSHDEKEPIVDITAKKKINVSSKPVAIIDLARSPFRELTPEYKKESNVIELSDSEGEKHGNKAPKSPDSTKLYDPFDILNSPSNENVSSSQQNSVSNLKQTKAVEHRDTVKMVPQTPPLQKMHNTEENLVTSSSNAFEKIFPTRAANKIEVLQNELIQNTNTSMTIESPYSPGAHDDGTNEYHEEMNESLPFAKTSTSKPSEKPSANLFDELFGSSSPPGLDRIKGNKKSDPTNKYINKLKRQERVIEEVKGAIKPHYSKRAITKEQYKEIMRKAVPKICHNKSGEINPVKIKHLVDSYVKFYAHANKKKRSGISETF